jgi:hypothetical protein
MDQLMSAAVSPTELLEAYSLFMAPLKSSILPRYISNSSMLFPPIDAAQLGGFRAITIERLIQQDSGSPLGLAGHTRLIPNWGH